MKMTWKVTAIAAAFGILATLSSATAEAATVYLLDDGTNSVLTVDSNTGAILNAYAAPVGFGTIAGLSAAEGGSTLIFTDDGSPPPTGGPPTNLFRLNPLTGAVLSSHALPINNRGGLSYEGTTVLAVNNGAPLVAQSPYGGAFAPVAPGISPGFPGALGGDDTGRHFVYGLDLELDANGAPIGPGPNGFGIYETNLLGAILNFLPNQTGVGDLSGLAFDGVNLYAVGLGSPVLFTLDATTGAVLGQVTVAARGDLVGAAVAPVPEPGTLALFGLGAFGLVGFVRRRKARRTA